MNPRKLATNAAFPMQEYNPHEQRDMSGSSLIALGQPLPNLQCAPAPGKRRKTTAAIELVTANDVYAAIAHACHTGLAPNRHLTINWEALGVDDPVAATGKLMKLMRDGASRHGETLAYVWVREKGPVVGEHVHVLFHLPAALGPWFRRNKAGWLNRCGAGRVGQGSKTTRIHGYSAQTGRPDVTSVDLYLANLKVVVDYVLKHCSPDVQHVLGIVSKGSCSIVGKRVSISQNLHRKARQMCVVCR